MSTRRVFLVEDDAFLADAIRGVISDLGAACTVFPSVAAAEAVISDSPPDLLLADLALPLADSALITQCEARAGHWGGVALIRLAMKHWHGTRYGLVTGQPSADARQWCQDNGVDYLLKPVSRSSLERLVCQRRLRAFVVHGRDLGALRKARDVLGVTCVDPVVLLEQPSQGRTVIEKFEAVSANCDCVVVVMTPDDIGCLAVAAQDETMLRVRQNVLFELGYFCGRYGRTSGRVLLLQFGDVEIPSDLAGVVRVDGTMDARELRVAVSKELGQAVLRDGRMGECSPQHDDTQRRESDGASSPPVS